MKSFRASGEAILGTLKSVSMHFTIKVFRASGEAILGTLKYVSIHFSHRALDLGFQKDLGAARAQRRKKAGPLNPGVYRGRRYPAPPFNGSWPFKSF